MRLSRILGTLAAAMAMVALVSPATASATRGPWYGPYVFTNDNGGRCLDADSQGFGGNETRIQLWDCYPPSQANQQWYLVQMPDTGYGTTYQIVGKQSGRCLDAAAQDEGRNGARIQLWTCLSEYQYNQLWWVYRNDYTHGYVIRNVASNRVLDAAAQDWGLNGARVQLWDDLGDNQSNQRWTELTW
jgi:hypothetical protein